MKTTLNTYIICLIIPILTLMGCEDSTHVVEQEDSHEASSEMITISKKQFEAGGMRLVKLKKKSFNETVYCTGSIDVPPQNRAIISAVMGGYVKNSSLLVGDKVVKGQLLLRLENPKYADLQQHYLEIKAKLAYLKEDFDRQKTLKQENITSNKKYLKSKSDYESAQASLRGLGEQLKMLSIKPESITVANISTTIELFAPIEGTIAMVNISRGTYVEPSEPVMEVLDLDHLHLELNVYEQDFMKVKKHQVILFSVPEASDTKYMGEVHLIGNTIEAESRTIKVHGHLESDSIPFAVGMFIEAEIVTNSAESYAVPEEAVFKTEEGEALIRLVSSEADQYVFEQTLIETTRAVDGLMAISVDSKIDTAASYLLEGYHFINEGKEGGHSH